MIGPAHAMLLLAFEDDEPDIRIAALDVLPEFAVRRSNELFDWLSVLLDDEDVNVQKAASGALCRAAPTFPSGVRSSLENELRSANKDRSQAAWKGLEALTKTWPDVVADHVDSLLLEPDAQLRRRAAKMIKAIVSRKTSVVWDLVSWALNDEDAQVRRIVAKSLPRLAKQDVRMGTMFAERAIADPDPDVRLSAIKAIEKLNRGHGRARDLILAGARSSDVRVRRACVDLLPKLMDEDELRTLVDDLLKTETDEKLVQKLIQYRFDAMLEGSEAEKNAALSPALAVPDIDKEVLLAQGKRIGMIPAEALRTEPTESAPAEKPPASASKPSLTRRPTQDEVMGYHDDDDDDFMPDDDMLYM
jgi:HEAT repeat protein